MLFLLPLVTLAKIEIRAMDHDVQEVTGRNFDSVIAKFLDSSVASVFFFKPGDAEAEFTMYNEVAKELTADAADTFLVSEPSKPKVLLFSNKDKVPTILKALSSDSVFRRSIKFAFVKHTEEAIVKKLKVKKFPSIVMVRGSKSEIREEYKGDFSFREIHQWVNLYSESGMGDKMAGAGGQEEESAEEARPWLVQEIPELTRDSQADVCFKGEGLCVIYLSDGPAPASDIDMLTTLKGKFTSQLDGRGTTFKWMWIDLKVETEFKELFDAEMMPGVVVFNPHKRLRFTKLEGKTASAQSIRELIDKIQGGDARFTMVKGQKLPKWADRPKGDKKKKKG